MEVSHPTTIYSENLYSIQLAKNLVFHARTKHIEVCYHFFRERVLSGNVELLNVVTDQQTADIFTQPLSLNKLRQFSSVLGLRHLDMANLRGRKDHLREQERSGSDRKAESDKEFDFDSTEEVEGKSRSQPNKGEMKPRRARRPRPRHGLMWLRA